MSVSTRIRKTAATWLEAYIWVMMRHMYTGEHLPRGCSTPRQPGVPHPRHQGGNRGRRVSVPKAAADCPARRFGQATAQLRQCNCRVEPQGAQVGNSVGAHQMAQHPQHPSHCGARALPAPRAAAGSANPGSLIGASSVTPVLFHTLTRSGSVVCMSARPKWIM